MELATPGGFLHMSKELLRLNVRQGQFSEIGRSDDRLRICLRMGIGGVMIPIEELGAGVP
jgi:hypothetical protein